MDERYSSWSHPFAFLILTLYCVSAIHESWNDPWTVAFVFFAYLDLWLLYWCLWMLNKSPESSPERHGLKVAVLFLFTSFTLLFTYRVAAMNTPLAVKAVFWGMAGLTILVAFYGLFVYRRDKLVTDQEPPLLV